MSDQRRSSSRKCVTKNHPIPSNSLLTVSTQIPTDKFRKTNNQTLSNTTVG
jgi:hypothetical protein